MMCEAILQFPALAEADGFIKTKEDLMEVLLKKKHLVEIISMRRQLTFEDLAQLFVSSDTPSSKKRRDKEKIKSLSIHQNQNYN